MVIDLTKFVGRFAEEAREHLETINNSMVAFEKDTDNLELITVIFRSIHTIKGSSKILQLGAIASLSHKIEDIFDAIRSRKIQSNPALIDLVLQSVDKISEMVELAAMGSDIPEADSTLIERLESAMEGELPDSSPELPPRESLIANTEENIQAASSFETFHYVESEGDIEDDNDFANQVTSVPPDVVPDNWLSSLSDSDRSTILSFIPEARENIEKIVNGLLALEKEHDPEILNDIFRSAHGIKGSARMIKLKSLADFAHKIEDILDKLRNHSIEPSSSLYDLLLESTDTLLDLLRTTEAGHQPKPVKGDIVNRLDAVVKGQRLTEQIKGDSDRPLTRLPDKTAVPTKKGETRPEKLRPAAVPEKITPFAKGESIRVSTERLDGIIKLMGEIVSNQNRLKYSMLDIQKIEKVASTVLERLKKLIDGTENSKRMEMTIIEPFDELFQKISSISSRIRDDINIQELLTHELQDKALKMRMMPLSIIFNTFHRTVRDLSHSLSKQVEFTVEGEETELDKKMIEKLGDPLMHMIRNAIDHGIEYPDIRRSHGKPETGAVNLSAYYEGGTVVIKLQDDGAGISKETLRMKALEKNLFDETALKKMSDRDIYDLIFHPGFSTSDNVTDISGRGVGMDVVKRNIVTDLKGSILIDTVHGQGTAFCIRLPLTLSIMDVLLIESTKMIFALSSNFVSEVLRVPKTDLIDVMNRKAIRLREHLIPVIDLGRILKVPGNKSADDKKMNLIIILQMGEERLGLIVDALISEEDMVIKPLPSHVKNNEWVTGIAITGKNELVNVLHIPTLFTYAKKITGNGRIQFQASIAKGSAKILVVDDSYNTREIEKSILEAGGYIVHVAEDGEDGLNKAQQTQYDLIITDCDMPKMNGFELTEHLKKDPHYKEKPIIIVTSKDKEEDRLKGLKAGADAYIIKGEFNQKILLETVESLIE